MPVTAVAVTLVGIVIVMRVIVMRVVVMRVVVMRVVVTMRMTVMEAHRAVEQPRVDPVHDERRRRYREHELRPRMRRVSQMLDRVAHELHRNTKNEDTVCERCHRLRAAQAERESPARRTRRDAHRKEADGEREDVHQKVKRVRLEDVAAGDLRADELHDEERADEDQNEKEACRLPPLGVRPRRRWVGLVLSHQTRS
jgi:hypothetical protein